MRTFIPTGHFFKKVIAIGRSLSLDIKVIDLDDFLSLKKPTGKKIKNKKIDISLKEKHPLLFLCPENYQFTR